MQGPGHVIKLFLHQRRCYSALRIHTELFCLQVMGRRGKRAASDIGQPHQRWAPSPHTAAASPAAAVGQPPLPQKETPPAAAPVPPAATPGGFPEQPSPTPQPQDEVMTDSEAAAGGDVAMEQGGPSGQPGEPTPRPSSGSLSDSGRASSFSPFSVAPPANESTSEESDTESDQSRDKRVCIGARLCCAADYAQGGVTCDLCACWILQN